MKSDFVRDLKVGARTKKRMGAATWGSQRPFIFVVTVLTPATT